MPCRWNAAASALIKIGTEKAVSTVVEQFGIRYIGLLGSIDLSKLSRDTSENVISLLVLSCTRHNNVGIEERAEISLVELLEKNPRASFVIIKKHAPALNKLPSCVLVKIKDMVLRHEKAKQEGLKQEISTLPVSMAPAPSDGEPKVKSAF
jgi:hypothetical protein